MTLGSLFDGIGGWQLAAVRAGIKPIWSSEIDEFCCAVTRRHFPNTIQLGDINLIDCPPHVDIITASSPCQDLSIAGKRSGINAQRSGLFFKAVELVRRVNPQLFIWENVTGAFTSNKGNDFRAVLEEILQEPVPLPKHWSYAGLVDGRRCQIAWRILDAQYWGVPQRRRRIFLIADFTGRRAAQILFEQTCLRRNSAPCSQPQQNSAARSAFGIKQNATTDIAKNYSPPQSTSTSLLVAYGISTTSCSTTKKNGTPCLNVEHDTCVVYGIGRDAFNQGKNAKFSPTIERDLQPPLTAQGAAAVCDYVVRRLTPLECERLQGLPDNWTQGGSDSKRYKALGNGLAQPCVDFILKRLTEVSYV